MRHRVFNIVVNGRVVTTDEMYEKQPFKKRLSTDDERRNRSHATGRKQ